MSYLDPILRAYEEKVLKDPSPHLTAQASPDAAKQMLILDGQLTWLVYMVGSIIFGHLTELPSSSSSSSSNDGGATSQESIDANLASRCLMLAQGLNVRAQQTGTAGPCSPRLELALVYFFKAFRSMYTSGR